MARKFLFFVILALGLAACNPGGTTGGEAPDLSGEWTLTAINGAAPLEGSTTTLIFNVDEAQMGGQAGCNQYGGSYELEGDQITFSEIFRTEMYCETPAGLMDQEDVFLEAFQRVSAVRQSGNTLELLGADGAVLLAFGR